MKNNKKFGRIALVVALLVVVCVASIAGTIAWLQDKTATVTNTFEARGIDINLIETKKPDGTVVAEGVTDWKAALIPGNSYSKNPQVTVVKPTTDVDIYLFVKYEEIGNKTIGDSTILQFDFLLDNADSGWTKGTGAGEGGNGVDENVWFRTVSASEANPTWDMIANDTVTINPNLTKEDMPTGSNLPELRFTAYAIQQAKSSNTTFTAGEAWNIAKTQSNP